MSIVQTDKPSEAVKQNSFQRFRQGLSTVLGLASIACLSAFVLIMCYMYLYAWQHNLYPKVPVPKDAIRGPWSSDETLNQIWRQALDPPVYAFLTGLLSCIAKPNKRAGITLLLSVVCVFVWLFHWGMFDD